MTYKLYFERIRSETKGIILAGLGGGAIFNDSFGKYPNILLLFLITKCLKAHIFENKL